LAVKSGAAAVVLKSTTVEKREGNPIPRVAKYNCGFINSVGLRNPGLKDAKKQIAIFLKKTKVPVIISVFAARVEDFQRLVFELSKLSPTAIELNLSCPNVSDEFGESISNKVESASKIIKLSKKEAGKVPITCKLSPNVDSIGEMAKACEQAGADAIAAINSVSQGMVIDIKRRRPVLGNKKGGVSGPGIKPIAIAKVYEIYEAVKIPILGIGGVCSWQDAVEMMMAGASLVGIGSVVYSKGFGVFENINKGIKKFMKEEKIFNIKNLIGVAHEK